MIGSIAPAPLPIGLWCMHLLNRFRRPVRREHRPKPSLVFQADRERELIPQGRQVLALINEAHDAASRQDAARSALLRKEIEEQLRTYEQEAREAYGKHWAAWHLEVVRSMTRDAFGEFEAAYAHDLTSLRLAPSESAFVKSAVNCCSGARRLGRHTEAVLHGEAAFRRNARADWVLINFALALYAAGAKERANDIIAKLRGMPLLDLHARYEQELQEMADLPEVASLLRNQSSRS